jgi:SAM-dependent methyltransferase
MEEVNHTCLICGNSFDNKKLIVREMMLGFRDEFIYILCNNCNSLQIKEIPSNLDRYYPNDQYYSYSQVNFIRSFLEKIRTKYSFLQKGLIFKILDSYLLNDTAIVSIGKLNPPKSWRILDVGSGSGSLLFKLQKLGFSNLMGIDPFLEQDVQSIKIEKTSIEKLSDNEKFDLIMFHYSFEHIPNPIETLIAAKKHLSDDGIILIRNAIISYAFEKYGSNWFQIDAPRHLHLQSLAGIKIMLDKSGLKLNQIYYDSKEDQFFMSENYAHDISMRESQKNILSFLISKFFSPKIIKFRKETKRLNELGQGDLVTYYVSKK